MSQSGNRLVTIKTYDDVGLAHLDRARLDHEGVFCRIEDELIISVAWHLSNAIGGIKLRVREVDLDKAIQIIKPVNKGFACPKCKSHDIVHLKLSWWSSFISFFMASIPGPASPHWKCINCLHSWKREPENTA